MEKYQEGFVEANGIKIHYYRSTPAQGGQAVVLLHGLTDNGMCWVRVADALRERYDVIMPDTRGHGLSDKPERGYAVEDLAADAAGLIEALHLDRPVVVGHSLGGGTATAVAGLYPELVRATVLEDPAWFAPSTNKEEGAKNAQRWQSDLLHQKGQSREALLKECSLNNPGWHADEVAAWAEAKYQMDAAALGSILMAISGGWQEFLQRAVCPFLLVTAEPGRGIVTPAMVKEAAGLWKQGREAHIANAGHSIHREQLEAYLAAVQSFLAEVFAPGA